jgi:hypothetical protein
MENQGEIQVKLLQKHGNLEKAKQHTFFPGLNKLRDSLKVMKR